jgi:hypothetical protein
MRILVTGGARSMVIRSSMAIFSVLVFFFAQVHAGEPVSNEADFKDRMEKLGPKNSQKNRLEALEWIIERSEEPFVKAALPALESLAKNEKDDKVRTQVVLAIVRIGLDQNPKIQCPMVLLEALEDKCVYVRQYATLAGQFRKFPPNALEFLLRLEKEGIPDMRSDVHLLLAIVGKKDERVLKILRAATKDKDARIRHNAHIFVFKVTNKLEDIVPYFLSYHADCTLAPPLPPGASEKELSDRVDRDLTHSPIMAGLLEHAKKRTDELATLLLQEAEQTDESARRRNAIIFLGQCFSAYSLDESEVFRAFGVPKPEDLKDVTVVVKTVLIPPRELVSRLQEMKVDKRLTTISTNDKDTEVRKAAAEALERIASANAKK